MSSAAPASSARVAQIAERIRHRARPLPDLGAAVRKLRALHGIDVSSALVDALWSSFILEAEQVVPSPTEAEIMEAALIYANEYTGGLRTMSATPSVPDPAGGPTTSPVIPPVDPLDALKGEAKKLLEEAAKRMSSVARLHGKAALEEALKIGGDTLKATNEVLAKIEETEALVAQGQLDAESGTLAVDLYFVALDNVKRAAVNAAEQEGIARVKALLAEARDIALTSAQVALKIGGSVLLAGVV